MQESNFVMSSPTGLFIPDYLDQSNVTYSTNTYGYQMPGEILGIISSSHWTVADGSLPPGANISASGLITGTMSSTALPLSRQQFVNANAPDLPALSQVTWDQYVINLLATAQEFDYQCTVQLTDNTPTIQMSHTVRIIYTKVQSGSSWFTLNSDYITYDPDQYYFLVVSTANDLITWTTPYDLGSVANGSIMQLSVSANSVKTLSYELRHNYYSKLPQGIIVMPDGMLSGRVSFRCHRDDMIDIPVDDIYEFTTRATTPNGWAYSDKLFTVKVDAIHPVPYNNIWIRSFPTIAERLHLESILADQSLFPDDLIYRINDPWFGKVSHLKFLFAPGLALGSGELYMSALANNHYNKKLMFDSPKVAVAVDDNLNVVYEVVYLPLRDDLTPINNKNAALKGEPDAIDLRPSISNYYTKNGQTFYTLHPNGLVNMKRQLWNTIGLTNNALPSWMTSVQPIPDLPGRFLEPLGYTPAVILAYAAPGEGGKIAFRIRKAAINFNQIRFEFDRYQLDDLLGKNYNLDTGTFVPGVTTVFDNSTTVFDQGSTNLINNLDYTSPPETGNKYLKFPKLGQFI